MNFKKLFLICILSILTLTVSADNYKAYQVAFREKPNGKWTEWITCNIRIEVTKDDFIIIYSKTSQVYKGLNKIRTYFDNDGEYTIEFSAVDNDLKKCTIKIRKSHSVMQLYVEYSDFMWVYNIK